MKNEEFFRFFKENSICALATVYNEKPHLRYVQFMLESEGKLYFCTANTKPMYKQMKANPFVELLTQSKDYMTTLRISGKVTFSNDFSIKQRILNENASLRSIYKSPENPILELFYIEHGTATFQYLNGKPAKFISF